MSVMQSLKSSMRGGQHATLNLTQTPGKVTVEIFPIANALTQAELVVFTDRGVAIKAERMSLKRPRMTFQLVSEGVKMPFSGGALMYPKFAFQQDATGKGFMITAAAGNTLVKWRWGTSWYNFFTGKAIAQKFVVTLT